MKRTLVVILGILIVCGLIPGCGGSPGPAEVNKIAVPGVPTGTLGDIPGPGAPKKK